MSEHERPHNVEDEAADDPRRYERTHKPPAGEENGEERAENVAGAGNDVADEDSYEGGLPA